ncbi:AAA family ATPase [Kitasatospora sp. NPDC001547]|uniref:AAA family ATPase n=1 Tax=Kitasatospora sp. NPDC001547 TaxID=3364015 RepID=UPI0036B2FC66
MAYVQHLSVRVPWHDTGWTGTVCKDPLANHACVMLGDVAKKRDDRFEARHRGQPWSALGENLPPCALERGAFMSDRAHTVARAHPYAWALKELQPAQLLLPAYSVQAIPYFWLHRGNAEGTVLHERPVAGYRTHAEERVSRFFGKEAMTWVMDGDNQRALIDTFFQDVTEQESLVFFYLKHSPFEEPPRRVLIGAAQVTGWTAPPPWPGSGSGPFPSHMWETTLRHTLRPDGTGGILLPVQALAKLAADGQDVSSALARAPETGRNFSYATEHVSADTAVASLMELHRAARAAVDLGAGSIGVPEASLQWLDEQLARAWRRRGPAPGLPAVMGPLGFQMPTFAAHRLMSAAGEGADPWPLLEDVLEGRVADSELRQLATGTRQGLWSRTTTQERQVFRLLSRFDLTSQTVMDVLARRTAVPVEPAYLLDNPYDLVTCTVDDGEPIAFETVDRGVFPDLQLTELHPLPVTRPFDDPNDRRRLDAAMTTILARAQTEGHTLLPAEQMNERLALLTVTCPLPTDASVIRRLGLHAEALHPSDDPSMPEAWSQLRRAVLQGSQPAYKLASAAVRRNFIRDRLNQIFRGPDRPVPADLAATLNHALDMLTPATDPDGEERSRTEKTAAFEEIYRSRVTILNGPAGTGKTTLIQALAKRPEVTRRGLLLLAPTGKARVQLEQKVGRPALTLAQFLREQGGRYDDQYGRYLMKPAQDRQSVGTVVVDEASMLTEDMLAGLLDAVEVTERLVLVGDPRQLPPIGAGRPFVDLERSRRPDQAELPWPRVAPGWAELTVLRRQQGKARDDLALARWYSGDGRPDEAESVWSTLMSGQDTPTLRAVRWGGRTPARVLQDVLQQEFGVTDELTFAQSYGAGTWTDGQGRVYPDYAPAPSRCEQWQALSPTRTRAHGTADLNRHLKQTFRRTSLRSAHMFPGARRVPPPLGPEQIVVGDKVVNVRNQYLDAYRPATRTPEPRRYVANGEIGVVTGQLKSRNMSKAPSRTDIEPPARALRREPDSHTHFGQAVRSKNEVIIADLLHRLARGRFTYEKPLPGPDGRNRYPDFTVTTDDPSRPIYWEHLGLLNWEHLGLLNDPEYRCRWEAKKTWYAQQGILPPPGGPGGQLLVTDDRHGVNERRWEEQFKAVSGAATSIRPQQITRRPPPGT